MLMFYGVKVLIRKTTTMYAARCEVYNEVGFSLSLPNSVPHGNVLIVTTSNLLLCLLRAAKSKHLKWCDAQVVDGHLSTRYENVSDIINISRMAGHTAQQHVVLGCLEIGQMVNAMRNSIPDHRLDTTIWPSSSSNTGSPKKLQTISVFSQISRLLFAEQDYISR